MHQFIKSKTAIIITHRVSSLMDYDKIIVLDDHRIKEAGTHAELVKRKVFITTYWKAKNQKIRNKYFVILKYYYISEEFIINPIKNHCGSRKQKPNDSVFSRKIRA